MVSPIQVFYFGDQSVEPCNSIEDLLKEVGTSNILAQFLQITFDALESAVLALSPSGRSLFVGRDVAQLVRHVRSNGIRHTAVSSVLSCIAQLGWTVLHRERNPERWSEHVDRAVVGVCTGTLSAIAATAALSDTDFLRLASAFVQLSLRLGLAVSDRSLALEGSKDSWSFAVSGVSSELVRKELRGFNESHRIPTRKRIYVSACTASSMTLSGPPSLLQDFFSVPPMRPARKLPLPVYGLFHASHLPLPTLDSVIGHSDLFARPVKGHRSLLSPGSQDDLDVPSLRDLIVRAVCDILQAPLNIDDDIQEVLRRTHGRDAHLTAIGPARIRQLERCLNPTKTYRLGSRKPQFQSSPSLTLDHGESIAVIGMAGRFPDAQNVDELWKILMEGRDLHRMIPVDRFDVHTHVDPTGKTKNTSLTPYGCFDEHVGEFDIALFKMSPREASQTDPMQRMMLLTAYEALESAGYYDNGDLDVRPKHGTFYGVGGDDYRQVNSGQDVDTNYITGTTRAFGPGRVSYYFGWEGPSMTVDTACSASAVAIHQAISNLKLKECDVALAGGANLLTCSDMFAGLSRAKFVSSTGPCKTFDETADGYCRADAAATVVLKRFKDAVRDKDKILGVIRSIETNHAGTAISLTHPEADTQSALFKSVLKSAGMGVDDIDHIELHGTGTQAGDLAEASSVVGLLDKPRPKDHPLTISSVKPNVGHSEAASGVTSLIKGLLMLQNQIIPRHIGIKTRFNPKLPPLDHFNVVVPKTNLPYTASSKVSARRMLVNNFNATGGITAMLLEEFKSSSVVARDTRRYYPITLSAASATALSHIETRLLKHLERNADMEVSHLSYTLTARRLHHKYRFACVAGSIQEVIQKLQAQLSSSRRPSRRDASAFGVFVFTGQASSYSGMAHVLFKTNEAFRSHLVRSDALCRDMGLPSFIEVITDNEADFSRFSQTQCQLALIALEIALASLLESWGIRPKAVIGHSLGEYSALCVSQVLSLADTLYLVGSRGLLLESTCRCNEYSMAVVPLPLSELENILHSSRFSDCEIACLNAPDQNVVGGPSTAIASLIEYCSTTSVQVTKLGVPYGFHSKQMDAALSDYEKIAEFILFQKPSVPVVSTLLGEIVQEAGTFNSQYLCRQTREPVRFEEALRQVEALSEDEQIPCWIEVGPGSACLPMIASTVGAKSIHLMCALDSKKPNWVSVSNLVTKYYSSNGNIRWDEYHKEYLDALKLLDLPSYPFELKKHWIQYEGDWVIRKNQKAHTQQQVDQTPAPTLESSTLHRLDNESVDKGIRKLCFTSSLSTRELESIIAHYKLNGQSACPSSVYVDMALAATSYLCKASGRDPRFPPVEISTLELCSDLNLSVAQSIRLIATQRPSDTDVVEISITSSDHDRVIELLRCKVITGDGKDWVVDGNSDAYLYQSRIDLLGLFLANSQVSKLSQSQVYKNLSSFISCEKSFQGIQEVLFNPGLDEAAAKISLPSTTGRYICDPHWLDTLIQLPSLVVNCGYSGTTRGRFVCCGWKRMHILLPMKPSVIYQAYARMQSHESTGCMIGDVHVFDEAGRAAAVLKSILFKPMSGSNRSNAESRTPNSTGQVERFEGLTDSAYSSGSQMSDSPRPSDMLMDSRQASNLPREEGDRHVDPDAGHQKTVPIEGKSTIPSNNVSTDKPSRKSPRLKDTINDDSLNKPLKAVLAVPEPRLEQPGEIKANPSAECVEGVDFDRIIAIIASEIGVEPDSLTDDILLDDLGVDSIIQISLKTGIQELLAEPLPDSLFVEYNSIAKLRRFFTMR